jgi:uncharacterized protein (DUF1684 family)
VNEQTLLQERREKDEFFKRHPYSPLTPEQQALFSGLTYFDPNPALDLTLEAEEFEDKREVRMQTSTGEVRSYLKWGTIRFTVDDQMVELTLFYSPDNGYFFLPFMDATSGVETYGAGRYLDPEWLGGATFHVDFNRAYSPYCAYNEPQDLAARTGRPPQTWTCPIPPAENRLKAPIRAGEKQPTGDWVEHE